MKSHKSAVAIILFLLFGIVSMANADTGVFVDSPVSGLKYQVGTVVGYTNSMGTFTYPAGQTVKFFIGSLLLGEVMGKSMISPIDLVPGATIVTDSTVTNISRLLQSLDNNKNLDDGIQIQSQVEEEIEGRQINFDQSTTAFGNDATVLGLIDALNARFYYSGNSVGELITAEKAQRHLRATLMNWNAQTSTLLTDLESGFPVGISGINGTYRGGPAISCLVGNINGDPQKEILVSGLASGPLLAFKWDGTPLFAYGQPTGVTYPALGKLNAGSSGFDVVSGVFHGQINAYDENGSILSGWPRDASNYITGPPAIADVNGDGIDEIFINEEDGCMHAYEADGTIFPGWPFCEHAAGHQDFSTPAIGDIDNDGALEIVAVNGGGVIYAVNADGSVLEGFPVTTPGHVNSYPVIGDVDGDGDYEIIVGGYNDFNYDDSGEAIVIISNDGDVEHTIDLTYHNVNYGSAPALADLDGNGVPEIVYQTEAYLFVFRYEEDAYNLMEGWPQRVSSLDSSGKGSSSPIIGDVDGDGFQEIVITIRNYFNGGFEDEVRLYEINGALHENFPKAGHLGSGGTAAIADIDMDGRNEIIIRGDDGTFNPVLFVYDLGGENHGTIEWGQYGRDFRHSSFYPKPSLGNINGDGKVDLSDLIHSLQITTGITPENNTTISADVNNDQKIGLQESIYILHKISRVRP